jgi:uncharacterized RDD family membrane protein YckC
MSGASPEATRPARFFERVEESGTIVQMLTPEGVPLELRVALAGDRLGAFLIDVLIIFAANALLVFGAVLATSVPLTQSWLGAFTQLALFLSWNFYFVFFELRWQGATPGKRLVGLRVVDRRGGPLSADAVIVRNLTRDVEFFMPLQALFLGGGLIGDSSGWTRLVGVLWLFVLAFLPLFNKLRLRIGDIVAGTVVVVRPRAVLLADQGAHAVAAPAALPGAAPAAPALEFQFSDEALDVYGIYELQVLEEVLRRGADGSPEGFLAMDAVADKIQRKIGWMPPGDRRPEPAAFLRDFYAALRARLEHKMLLGEKKLDKYSRKK